MKQRALFVYNPNAGKGKIRARLSEILEILSAMEYEFIVYPTKKKLDAKEIVKEYVSSRLCDMVICSGGDGTLNEVTRGMLEARANLPIGYIPSGTTNDFSYSLKIPKNMDKAAQLIVQNQLMYCDIGEINHHYFVYSAAFGIFSDVSYDTPQNVKNVLGRTAYILSGISKLHSVKSFHMKLEYNGIQIEDDFIYGMFANSDSVGGFHGITGKGVLLDDGYYEMILVRMPKNILEISTIINELLRGELSGNYICYARVTEVHLTADVFVPWTLDGEFGGNFKEAELYIHKQAIPYICGRTPTEVPIEQSRKDVNEEKHYTIDWEESSESCAAASENE